MGSPGFFARNYHNPTQCCQYLRTDEPVPALPCNHSKIIALYAITWTIITACLATAYITSSDKECQAFSQWHGIDIFINRQATVLSADNHYEVPQADT